MPIESSPQFELPEVTKEQAIVAYRPFVDGGITSPDELDLNDPEVIRAHELFHAWQKCEEAKAEGDPLALHEWNFTLTTFYYDIGFTDPTYLEDVTGWLSSDLGDVDKDGLVPIPELAKKIKKKIKEIEKLIPKEVKVVTPELPESELENKGIDELLAIMGNIERLRETGVKKAVFNWFMERITAIKKSDNPDAEKEKLVSDIKDIRLKIGYYEWLETLERVYLQGKEPMPYFNDKKLLKELSKKNNK